MLVVYCLCKTFANIDIISLNVLLSDLSCSGLFQQQLYCYIVTGEVKYFNITNNYIKQNRI